MEVFESSKINTCQLKNRFVRSATHEGYADENGFVTQELVEFVRPLSKGGIGLIISGHAYVSPEGQASPRQLGVYSDECIPGLSRLRSTFKQTGSKTFLQLAHAGAGAREKVTGLQPVAPSVTENADALGAEQINDIVTFFTEAAVRAKAALFDGVQIHAAHGYLLSQFLSPHYNKRTDQFGGSIENRARIIVSIVKSIRYAVGEVFAITIKMNSEDFIEDGFTRDEMLKVAKLLESVGVDAIELSGGTIDSTEFMPVRKGDLIEVADEVYYKEAAQAFKSQISVPLILVGGVKSLQVARDIVNDSLADFVALSRPLIRQPGLVSQWEKGDSDISKCVRCNLCFRPLMTGKGLFCVAESKIAKKSLPNC